MTSNSAASSSLGGRTAADRSEPLTKQESWTHASEGYQQRIGACTVHGTARLVEIINELSPFTEDSYVLDNGAGTGSILIKVKEKSPATKILATDISPGMLERVDALKLPNVSTQVEDASTLAGLPDDTFTHVLTSFMIQFTPDPHVAVKAMHRVLAPNQVVGIAIWGTAIDHQIIHEKACARLNPDYVAPRPETVKSWRSEPDHRDAMAKAGFKDVGTEAVRMPFYCRDADHFLEYWFDSKNPVPKMFHDDWTAHGGDLAALRAECGKIVQEEYDGGKDIFMGATLGWGRK
ncbi:hypothetical protein M8818_005289 [Zalaria obscura]|uniref:Uncharacterized protein n=1 Tax=Zalaria obscura TaxID=2024903 RepID=A0ACC3SB79_9PEZI